MGAKPDGRRRQTRAVPARDLASALRLAIAAERGDPAALGTLSTHALLSPKRARQVAKAAARGIIARQASTSLVAVRVSLSCWRDLDVLIVAARPWRAGMM